MNAIAKRPAPEGVVVIARLLTPDNAVDITLAGNNITPAHAEWMVTRLLAGTLPYPDINIEAGIRVKMDGHWLTAPAGTTIEGRNGQPFICYPVDRIA